MVSSFSPGAIREERSKPACSDDEHRCENGNCVPKDALCNLYDECGDGSDETSCRKSFFYDLFCQCKNSVFLLTFD